MSVARWDECIICLRRCLLSWLYTCAHNNGSLQSQSDTQSKRRMLRVRRMRLCRIRINHKRLGKHIEYMHYPVHSERERLKGMFDECVLCLLTGCPCMYTRALRSWLCVCVCMRVLVNLFKSVCVCFRVICCRCVGMLARMRCDAPKEEERHRRSLQRVLSSLLSLSADARNHRPVPDGHCGTWKQLHEVKAIHY